MLRARPSARDVMMFTLVLIQPFAWAVPATTASGDGAQEIRVAVGEMLAGEHERALSTTVGEVIEAQPGVRLAPAPSAELVLRGSVVRWDQRRVHDDLEIRCEVSMVVAEARGGSIRAMLRGRGGARGRNAEGALRRDALRAAVRGALRPLSAQGRSLARSR